ncbi:hypothetical protein [Bradyrhizobium sp. STM 3557]|uniref:hypothetical protein n=1 Tax=Bradyrhizobium sp. STM 3557 TaxID=578920 RepID=UPI00388EF4B7
MSNPPNPFNADKSKTASWTRRKLLGIAVAAGPTIGTIASAFVPRKAVASPVNPGPFVSEELFPNLVDIAARGEAVAAISTIVTQSKSVKLNWQNRGLAPRGYMKGMALVFAKVYLKLKAGDPAANEMAKANSGDMRTDAIAWYADIFSRYSMSNADSGIDTLRHLFVLLIGLGMRESLGKYCAGRDIAASNTSADTAQAGLFQSTFAASTTSPLLTELFRHYLANPAGFAGVFADGVQCTPAELENVGNGNGERFQRLSKECPAFAVEYAAICLRQIRSQYPSINRREATVRPECDEMLRQVQSFVDVSPNINASLGLN